MKYLLLLFGFLFIYGVNAQNLTADFSVNTTSVCLGDGVIFTDLSVAGPSPIAIWTWDFGDGFASQSQNPSHTYTQAGTFNITLTVQAADGTSDVEIKSAFITVNPLPIVNFSLGATSCTLPFNAIFNNTSSSGGYSYAWDFDNGQTSTDFTPTGISYTTVGSYNVSLIVTNRATGCVNTLITPIQVDNFNTDINSVDSVCVGQTASINDASTPGVNSWAWDFGDGNVSSTTNNNHVYTTPGTYTITLNSSNTVLGCTDVATQTIVVNPAPSASFTSDITIGCNPSTVNFTNNTTGATQFTWTFGDGTSYVGMNPPPHVYSDTGSYDVLLVVANDFGCSHLMYLPNLITIEEIEVGFMIDQMGGCDPLDVNYTDTTSVPDPVNDPIVTWNWDFGNGNTFTGQFPPTQTYGIGIYDISLNIVTASGCVSDTVYNDSVTVGMIDTVGFTNFPIDVCAKEGVVFTNTSVISIPHLPSEVTYAWEFGDGGTSIFESPGYGYQSDTGYFDVQLIVDFRGCQDTAVLVQAVHVNAPISNFSPLSSLFCNPASLPVNVPITDNSIIGEIPDDCEMTWSFGDGTTVNFDDPDFDDADLGSTDHDYSNYGSYTIKQVIYNNTTGCVDSSSAVITITYTDANFTFTNDSLCLNSPLNLIDSSTSSHNLLYDTIWNYYTMGNGVTLYDSWQNYTYPIAGSYDIIHYVTNAIGCSDSDTLFGMDILELPQAGILPDATSGCAPLNVIFSNTSTSQGNGTPLDYFVWEFNDGTFDTTYNVGQTVSDLFTTENIFSTTLFAIDEFGCQSPSVTVLTDLTKPTANFAVNPVVCDLENYNAVNQSTGNGPLTYEWLIDGNSVSNGINYSDQFDEVSSDLYNSVVHAITLITTDVNGCIDSLETPITVSLPHADANFSFSGATINAQGEFVCPPVFASLTDSSSSVGAINNWDWTFGNGNSSTLQNPQNTYVFAGTYTATLSITDQYGCVDDSVFLDYITINGPSGDPVWYSVGTFCEPEFQFITENQVGITNIEWVLGNGDTLNNVNAFDYAYDTTGTYMPTVILSDDFGCEVPYQLPWVDVAINELEAFFTASMLEGEASEIFTFDDQSITSADPIVEWYWDFTEASVFNNTDANVDYDWGNLGYQNVTLTVSDANGCSASYTIQVLITAEFIVPNVFSPNGDGVNEFFEMDFDVFNGYDYVILNRWGNVMSEKKGHSGVVLWDGFTKSGTPASDGVYFYIITGTRYDGVTISVDGNVTLVR